MREKMHGKFSCKPEVMSQFGDMTAETMMVFKAVLKK
jgi:hypothetical protein